MITEEDAEAGGRLVAEFEEFLVFLIRSDLSTKTIKKHAGNLWYLGGEIIRDLDDEFETKEKSNIRLLDYVGSDGGVFCRHLDQESELKSYDATCRKLWRYLMQKDKIGSEPE